MNKLLALTAVLMFAGNAGEAAAFSWTTDSTITTARGTYTHEGQGSCSNGACSRSGSTTGPNGHTVSSSGSITRVGPGSFDYSETVTGPRGRSVTRSGSITRNRF